MKLNLTRLILIIPTFFFIVSCGGDDNNPPTDETPIALSAENEIVALLLFKENYSQTFEPVGNAITGTVDSSIELTDIIVQIVISNGATISPDPALITTIDDDLNFTVTAENGDNRIYSVSIQREFSRENAIVSFQIQANSNAIDLTIDEENNTLTRRIPEGIDPSDLSVSYTISERASINPDPSDIVNYSDPVDFTVTAENGDTALYTTSLTRMTSNFTRTCEEANFWKWFGGDDRSIPQNDIFPFNRNVGTGQAISLESDFTLETFSIALREGFRYDSNDAPYGEMVSLILNVRNSDTDLIASATTQVPASFNGGLIDFDLKSNNLLFDSEKMYIFQWYLFNGTELGITASSPGTSDEGEGFCFGGGYAGESKINLNTPSLEDQETWREHGTNFNISIKGKL